MTKTATAFKTKIEKLEDNMAKIEVTFSPDVAKQAYDKTLKKMGSRVNISGFRQGKAPNNVIEKYVGVENIKGETLNELYNANIPDIVSENKLDFATNPSIDDFNYEIGKEFVFTMKVELKPEFEPGKYKSVSVNYEEFAQAPDIMELELKAIQERFSELTNVEGRKAKATDVLVFDFEGFLDGTPFEHGKAEKYTLDLANSNFIPGFAEGLVGHKIGEDFTIDVTFPENYHAENLKGKPVQFKILIHEIKEHILPEINDEFAKKASKFTTLDELKADIQKYLDESLNLENDRRKNDAIFDYIIENTQINISRAMIERETEAIKDETKQRLASQGGDWDKLVTQEGGIDKVNAQVEPEAIKRIKNSLLVEKIALLEDVKIEQQDIIEQINLLASAYGTQAGAIIEQIQSNPASIAALSQQAAAKKVSKLLLENNTFKAVAAKTPAKKAKKG